MYWYNTHDIVVEGYSLEKNIIENALDCNAILFIYSNCRQVIAHLVTALQ